MKRGLKLLVVLVVVLLCIGTVGLFFTWVKLPEYLSNHLTKSLGVAVNVDDVDIYTNRVEVDGLSIGNPRGYTELPKAFSSEKITCFVPLRDLMRDQIVVEELIIDQVYLGLIFDGISSASGNWTVLMKQLGAQQGGGGKKKSFLIKKLQIRNISPELVYKSDSGKVIKLPMIPLIELENISSEGCFPADQLLNSALGEMIKQVFVEENLKNMLQGVVNEAVKQVDQFVPSFMQGLFH